VLGLLAIAGATTLGVRWGVATPLLLVAVGIAGTAASVSLWNVLGNFVFALVVAVVIGYLVGKLNLQVRARVQDATVNTVSSFAVPFIASNCRTIEQYGSYAFCARAKR
jgi:hypothetical protein